jgi:hypothetical protein
VEWWVDGIEQTPASCPTIAVAPDSSIPGLGHEVGFYRGPSQPYMDTMYIDGVKAGPTFGSVGVRNNPRATARHRKPIRVRCRAA